MQSGTGATAADLEAAFPVSRIHFSTLQWHSVFWLAYLPVGALLAGVRLAGVLVAIAYARARGIGAEFTGSNQATWFTGVSSAVSDSSLILYANKPAIWPAWRREYACNHLPDRSACTDSICSEKECARRSKSLHSQIDQHER